MQDVSPALKTHVLFDDEARDRLFDGIKIASEAVCCTLGPRGQTVLIQGPNDTPVVTKDGVSVSKAINFKDPIKRMGANLVREAASRTNDVAGDGTTTATALAYSLITECRKLIASDHNVKELRDGLKAAIADVIAHVCSKALRLTSKDEIVHVATISANGDTNVGQIVASAFDRVGVDGIITVEDAKSMHTTLDIVDGMQFDRGYLSPYFVTNSEKMHVLYTDALVLVTDKKISMMQDIVATLEHVHKSNRSLLIIADDVDGEALQALVLNHVKANLRVVAVKAPGYGQLRDAILGDICALTGAKLVSASTGTKLQDACTVGALGTCKKVIVDPRTTTIVGDPAHVDVVKSRSDELKTQLDDPTLEVEQRAHLRQRLARLSCGVAVVKVGGLTEVEMIERKYRIEDALNATRAAIAEGIVPGGGCALLDASVALRAPDASTSFKAGYNAVLTACQTPLRRIVTNAGKSDSVVIDKLFDRRTTDTNVGYDASQDVYCDMYAHGIIDPLMVTRTALENAASVAVLYVSLGAVVSNVE